MRTNCSSTASGASLSNTLADCTRVKPLHSPPCAHNVRQQQAELDFLRATARCLRARFFSHNPLASMAEEEQYQAEQMVHDEGQYEEGDFQEDAGDHQAMGDDELDAAGGDGVSSWHPYAVQCLQLL